MTSLLREPWIWFCKMVKIFPSNSLTQNQTPLKDKAIVVAGRIIESTDKGSPSVFCPICFNTMWSQGDAGADLATMLAAHLSLRHPGDVTLQWDFMQKKIQPTVHLPSLIVGVAMAAAFRALLAISARNRAQQLTSKTRI